MKGKAIDPRLLVGGATVSVALLLVLLWLFAVLSTPARADQRLAVVEARLDRARAALKAAPDMGRYPPGSLCGDADQGVAIGRALVEAAAGKAGVALGDERVTPGGPAPGPLLAALSVDIAAKGQEAALTGFLRELSSRQPLIIADAVDLSSDGAEVSLRLKGRFLCHDRRLP